jgi:hypothetical protein
MDSTRGCAWLEAVAIPMFLPSVLRAPAQEGEMEVDTRDLSLAAFQKRESGRYHLTGTWSVADGLGY